MSISSFKEFIDDKIQASANAKSMQTLDAVRSGDKDRAMKLVGDVDGLREAKRIIHEAYLMFVKEIDSGDDDEGRTIY